jgi:lipoic acid synthetase
MAVAEYVTPEAFAAFKNEADRLGFRYAAAGPKVRSSYRAGEFYLAALAREAQKGAAAAGAV